MDVSSSCDDDEPSSSSVGHDTGIPNITTHRQRPSYQVQLGLANATTLISCTLIMFRDGEGLSESHVFVDIPISTNYISMRTDVHSILIGTLLAALRPQLKTNFMTPKILVDIINGEAYVQKVEMATTRVPEFGPYMCNPSYGYRGLGPLSFVNVQLDIPPSPSSPFVNREILAVEASDPLTRRFMSIWSPFELQVETHFIIIFEEPPPLLLDSYAFQSSPSFAQTLLYHKVDDWRRGVPSAAPPESNSLARNGGAAESFGYDGISTYKSGDVVRDNTLNLTYSYTDTANDIINKIHYRSDEKGLLEIVPNHRAMGQALAKQENQENTTVDPMKVVNPPDSQQLSASSVLQDLGRNTSTLKRKSEWSDDAEEVTKLKVRKRPVPRKFLVLVSRSVPEQ